MQKSSNLSLITDSSHRAVQAHELAKFLQGQNVQISCGLEVVEKAANSKAEFKVHILDPQKNYDAFDVIFVPSHDPHPNLPNIIETTGLINHISPKFLQGKEQDFGLPRPYTAVLIGGRHIGGNFTEQDAENLARILNQKQGSVLVTTSKRTEKVAAEKLMELLKTPHIFYDFNHDGQAINPYEAILASADEVIVTADSVRMVSEVASSGKPVNIFTPQTVHFSYLALKDAVNKAILPLNEAKRCAEIVVAKINLSRNLGG